MAGAHVPPHCPHPVARHRPGGRRCCYLPDLLDLGAAFADEGPALAGGDHQPQRHRGLAGGGAVAHGVDDVLWAGCVCWPTACQGASSGGQGTGLGSQRSGPCPQAVRCEHAHTRKPCVCTATGRSAQAGLVTEARRPGQAQDDRRGLAETCQRRRAGHRPEGASTQGLNFVLKAWWGMGRLD